MIDQWSDYEKQHAVNDEELMHKVSVIDYPTLISTVRVDGTRRNDEPA